MSLPLPSHDRCRILHLEDDDLDARLVAADINEAIPTCQFTRVRNRGEFLAALAPPAAYDLILSDFALPDFDGFAALSAARKAFPDIPFIIVSGAIGEDRVIEALRSGLTDYVLKDRLHRLVPAVQRALDESVARQERALAIQALRDSEARYRALTDSIPQLVWTARPDGHGDFLSSQWQHYTGREASQLLGTRWLDVVHPDDRPAVIAAWHAASTENAPYDLEYRIRRKDGVYHWFKARGTPVRDAHGKIVYWFGSCTDIDALKRAQQDAADANAAKDRFLAALSHELRTPLNPALLAIGAMQSNPDLPPRLRADLQMVRDNIELEARLIDDLLDLTRIARNKLQLRREDVDVHAIVLHALETVRESDLTPKHIAVAIELDASCHHVAGDAVRLEQVFWNLLKNAGKFTPPHGRITIRTWNNETGEVSGQPGPSAPVPLLVAISDTGIGIPPDALTRIFDPFDQGPAEDRPHFGGLGLGLAISRAIVQRHGGAIAADSPGRNRGATFTVTLQTIPTPATAPAPPSRRVPAPAPRPPATPILPPNPRQNPLVILLVEDHPDTARIMARLLKAEGHNVTTAGSVREALNTIDHKPFDLLISDLGLPDGSGHDLLRTLRSSHPHLPAIALSGYGMDHDIQASLDAGFTAHLTKPVQFPSLLMLLSQVKPMP